MPPTRPLPEVPGVTHSRVRAGAVELHVAEAGEGPPLVLVHGWPQHWYAWRHLIPPLAERNRVICPDLRGLGWSEAPPSGYDKETLAHDVIALFDALGVERCRLVGHDWGGWVGFMVALFAPERVERLVAMGIVHPFGAVNPHSATSLWRLWYFAVFGAPLLGPLVARTAGYDPVFRGRTAAWSEEDRRIYLEQFQEPARARAASLLYRMFLLRDGPALARGRYRRMRLHAPTLLLNGDRDPVVKPEMVDGFEPYADDMTADWAPGCSHWVMEEAPELVLRRLREFLPA